MAFRSGRPLIGATRVPGDKSISHRALMLAAIASGRSRITGLSPGGDVRSTADALRQMGVAISNEGDQWTVEGRGEAGLSEPPGPIDLGNSGTSARLLMGLIASHPIRVTIIGDSSLSQRPMERVAAPLRTIGAAIQASPGGTLPVTVEGQGKAMPRHHRLAIASAQVKSALMLAALRTPGTSSVTEPVATRDHSERLFDRFGAPISIEEDEAGGRTITITGPAALTAQDIRVPGDPSSAAFLAVAALIVPGSDIFIRDVCINPLRTGLFEALRQMGGDIIFVDKKMVDGEPVANIRARHSRLSAIDIAPQKVPSMIDEFPIFFIAAAFADGTSRARGLRELRVKESDRITAMADGLKAIGVDVEESEDGLAITGSGGGHLRGGASIASRLDHRIAMSFAVAGLHCDEAVTIDSMMPVDTSFPGFIERLRELQNA
ncbi:3-phosphoshikimate 1-carboxyvinyltransferase [Allosphingosinicella vermicomposti]|uniref:3-phosphoshikimate 1-carboxyvinyltransferase n=1 Tax=Allosphingosinicella vermicomposti TaxID=614671 RepID=UPI003159F540